jgi:hypothetical protein
VDIEDLAVLFVIAFLGVQPGAREGASRPDRLAALRCFAGGSGSFTIMWSFFRLCVHELARKSRVRS